MKHVVLSKKGESSKVVHYEDAQDKSSFNLFISLAIAT